ncbi:Lrp/AsnC family transcriptional regulator [Actinomadura terrae]|uniref:Lrp/AsnC family transcriptional regulator n=1 Tax=Actinomadura terrae TaxID=604353 RepID=UPI001FA754CD|nr:Lrp/AsnC family transcriptional regulator [Actinomadura terrae]
MTPDLKLDTTDIKILAALQNNGRINNKDLAATVHLAPSTCLERVNRLRRAGIITGHRVEVDPEKLGRPLEALLFLQVRPHKRPLVDPFVEFVLSQPETRYLYHLAGPEDFLVHVAVESANDLQRIVLDKYTARDEIALVRTNLVFQRWNRASLLPPGIDPAQL